MVVHFQPLPFCGPSLHGRAPARPYARDNGPSAAFQLLATGHFGCLFLGQLWVTYCPGLATPVLHSL